jgi:hypothetical protein
MFTSWYRRVNVRCCREEGIIRKVSIFKKILYKIAVRYFLSAALAPCGEINLMILVGWFDKI